MVRKAEPRQLAQSVISMSPCSPVIEALKVQREMKLKGQYIFRDQEGALMIPDHIREVIWKPILERAGVWSIYLRFRLVIAFLPLQ